MFLRFTATAAVSLFFCCLPLNAQAPRIDKVDPPNWWINMPAPMLLVNGEHLSGARFTIGGLPIEHTSISENGHWAELWLSKDATTAGEITLKAEHQQGRAQVPFKFEARRAPSDGFAGFSSRDVMYLIMTDRFADGDHVNDGPDAKDSADSAAAKAERANPRGWHGGDLRGIIDHLDYLQTLGITTIWITPVYQNHSPEAYHGYNATDMYAVDAHYGSLDDLKALSKALHERGMKLVLDTVPNHVGPTHPWVDDPPTPDWFHGTKASHRPAAGVFPALMDPNASKNQVRDVEDGWFVNLLPDLNQENPLVSTYLIQNAMWWIEQTSADGLRLDTFPYVGRTFWHNFHQQLADQYPRLTTVGEVFNETYILPPAVNAFFAGGSQFGKTTQVDTGLYTPFDYPLYGVLRNILLHNAPMTDLDLLLRQDSLYPHPERLVTLLGSHDTSRFMSEPGATPAKLLLAFGIISTVRGTPVIYSGDEIGMLGGQDPDNRRDFPDGFPASVNLTNAFEKSGRAPAQSFIHDGLKQILKIRRSSAELSRGEQQNLEADPNTIAFVRGSDLSSGCAADRGRVLVLANKSTSSVLLSLPTTENSLTQCASASVLLGDPHSVSLVNEHVQAEVPPVGILVVHLN